MTKNDENLATLIALAPIMLDLLLRAAEALDASERHATSHVMADEIRERIRHLPQVVIACEKCNGTSWGGGTDVDPRPWCNKCGGVQPGWNGSPLRLVMR